MITLASDFGSPYPAAMAGVVYDRSDARVVDVTHELPRQNVRAGAFWMREILPYYPPSVHVIVVDPGVGTDRRGLVCRAGTHILVGPDNGVLYPVARRLADGAPCQWFAIDDSNADSRTFHGRDVFAPMAARVHDHPADELAAISTLEPYDAPVECHIPEATVESDRALGAVIVVDGFGNCITNVPGGVLDENDEICVDGDPITVGATFSAVGPGEAIALVGSHGNVELDVNQGRGDDAFGLDVGDQVEFEWG